jgi:hypothetical protein
MENAFKGARNLEINATDIPNLSHVNSMESMFSGIKGFAPNININDWDVSHVRTFRNMFGGDYTFNQDIGD